MIIGLYGKAGAGKNTVGDYLVKKYRFEEMSFAQPLKRLVKDVFVLDDYTVYDRVAREQPLKEWPNWTVRKLLQFIGTELFRDQIDRDIWAKSLLLRMSDRSRNYVITDLRFPNEAKYLSENSDIFKLVKIVRPGFEGNVGLAKHESESYDLQGDITIQNDSTIEDLYKKIDEIMADEEMVGLQ